MPFIARFYTRPLLVEWAMYRRPQANTMPPMKRWLLGLLLFGCSPRPVAPREPQGVAFVHVAVIPMDGERVLADQTVIVRGGRIVAMGPAPATPVPGDVQRVEGQGRYLLPGLGDMHTHLGAPSDLTMLVANGVTFLRNMWGSPLHLIWRRRIESGSLLGPRIFTTGPLIDGSPPIWHGSEVVDSAADAERVVAEQKAAGYDFLKVYSNLSPEAFDAIAAAARKHGLRMIGHVPTRVGLEHALSAGQYSIEHLTGYFGAIQRDDSPLRGQTSLLQLRQLPRYADEKKIPEVVGLTRKAGAWNCVTITVLERMAALNEGRDLGQTVGLEYMAPQMVAGWNPDTDFRLRDPAGRQASRENLPRMRLLRAQLVRALSDAGAPILAGTDFPNPYVVPGFALHDELVYLVEAGLTPYQALRAATAEAARFLGADFGVVGVGRPADLVLLEANPLVDIKATRRLLGVMVRGRWLPQTELATMLAEVKRSHAPRDRFAGLPALPGAVTYEVRYNGAPAGAERLVREGVRVRAQSVSDDPQPATDQLTIEGATLTLEGDHPEGPVHAAAQGAQVQVHIAGLPPMQFQAAGGVGDAVPTGPWVAVWLPILQRVEDLGIGQSRQLRELVLDSLAEPTNGTLTLTRQADQSGARVYAFTDERKNASSSGRLVVDGRGLRTLEITLQIGVVQIERRE
jgi:imidazolonepropionase-like amidohydrolase